MDDHPLKIIRTQRGLSLRRLGVAARIDFRRLHFAEQGLWLQADELDRLARVLGVEPGTLTAQRQEVGRG